MLHNYLMEKLYTELVNATFKRFIKCAKMYLNNWDYFSKDSLNCTYNKQLKYIKDQHVVIFDMEQQQLKLGMDLQQFLQHEDSTSARFVWNHTPQPKGQLFKNLIPAAVHYSPMNITQLKGLSQTPLTCYYCQGVFTCHSRIDFSSLKVQCCFCLAISSIPIDKIQRIKKQLGKSQSQQYGQFSQSLQCQTITYVSSQNQQQYQEQEAAEESDYAGQNQFNFNFETSKKKVNSYILLIDKCLPKQQIQALKNSLIQNIIKIPDTSSAQIAVISYSQNIYVHDLKPKHPKISSVTCLSGQKNHSIAELYKLFAINPQLMLEQQYYEATYSRFFATISKAQSKQNLIEKIKKIKTDLNSQISKNKHQRPLRAVGACLQIAVSLRQIFNNNPRILLFSGGPCTIGPGQTIKPSYSQSMKSLKEANFQGEDNECNKFYMDLGLLCLNQGVIIDYFLMSVEELGLIGMRQLVKRSGGALVMHEQFKGRVFSQSLARYFQQKELLDENLTNCYITVRTSPQVEINGALGNLISLYIKKLPRSQKKTSCKVIGQGNTNQWYIGSLSKNDTFTFLYQRQSEFFEQKKYFFQFQTVYRHKYRKFHRITTVQRYWTQNIPHAVASFDQQAAVVLLAKLAGYKFIQEDRNQIRQWLDSMLIKFCHTFAIFCKGLPSSFVLPQKMKMMPQFVYHLRKAAFVRNYGLSADEMYYQIHNIQRQSVTNCLITVQPAILKYSLQDSQAQPVALEFSELKPQVILLLDSYYNVILWYGESVKLWCQADYHKQPEYQHVKQLTQMPQKDITAILNSRFPVPNFYQTHHNDSKERFLKSRLMSYKGQHNDLQTDQIDLKGFTQSLIGLVVNGQAKNQIGISSQGKAGLIARLFS